MKRFSALITWLQGLDPNVRNYWMGLLMLFIGLSFFASLPLALVVVGGGMAVESAITSYLVVWLTAKNARSED